MVTTYIDGGALGNPGKSGIGYLIYKDKKVVKEGSVFLGIQTNNFAEYMALIFSLIDILNMGEKECEVFTDSKLVCEQVSGRFKVKNSNIFPLFVLARNLVSKFKKFTITHIDREKNEEADKLVKKAVKFLEY